MYCALDIPTTIDENLLALVDEFHYKVRGYLGRDIIFKNMLILKINNEC